MGDRAIFNVLEPHNESVRTMEGQYNQVDVWVHAGLSGTGDSWIKIHNARSSRNPGPLKLKLREQEVKLAFRRAMYDKRSEWIFRTLH